MMQLQIGFTTDNRKANFMKTTYRSLLEGGKAGKKFIGTYVMCQCEPWVEIMKMAGFDYLIMDLEHERLTMSEVMPMLYACEACGMATVVRVPGVEEEYIKKALDMGASCIKVPDVRTAEQARRVVQYSKYPPQGQRGACPFVRGNQYGADRQGCWERANREIAVDILIEGEEGIANCGEILAVEGIDSVSIGQVDLSVRLGVPGNVFHPRVIQGVLEVADQCLKHDIQLSAQIVKPEDVKMYNNHPAITHFHTDLPQTIFYQACKGLCDQLKANF